MGILLNREFLREFFSAGLEFGGGCGIMAGLFGARAHAGGGAAPFFAFWARRGGGGRQRDFF